MTHTVPIIILYVTGLQLPVLVRLNSSGCLQRVKSVMHK